jgi:hypothetical protein
MEFRFCTNVHAVVHVTNWTLEPLTVCSYSDVWEEVSSSLHVGNICFLLMLHVGSAERFHVPESSRAFNKQRSPLLISWHLNCFSPPATAVSDYITSSFVAAYRWSHILTCCFTAPQLTLWLACLVSPEARMFTWLSPNYIVTSVTICTDHVILLGWLHGGVETVKTCISHGGNKESITGEGCFTMCSYTVGPPLWSSGQSFWLQIQRSRVRFPALP